jgi:UDP-N-acetyl-D-galactosamine dehydrogenase
MSFDINELRIGIIGLGYVGLPLAVEFGKKYPTVGFDINAGRIAELSSGVDSTLECSGEELAEANHLVYSSNDADIADCNFYIVTVPTPIGDIFISVTARSVSTRATRNTAYRPYSK